MWKSIKWCKSSEVECCHLFIYLFRRGTLLEVISEYKQSVNCNMSFGIVNIKLKFNLSKGWQLNLTGTEILPLTSRPTSYTSILILILSYYVKSSSIHIFHIAKQNCLPQENNSYNF